MTLLQLDLISGLETLELSCTCGATGRLLDYHFRKKQNDGQILVNWLNSVLLAPQDVALSLYDIVVD